MTLNRLPAARVGIECTKNQVPHRFPGPYVGYIVSCLCLAFGVDRKGTTR
jgi:hypothetical protein